MCKPQRLHENITHTVDPENMRKKYPKGRYATMIGKRKGKRDTLPYRKCHPPY